MARMFKPICNIKSYMLGRSYYITEDRELLFLHELILAMCFDISQ